MKSGMAMLGADAMKTSFPPSHALATMSAFNGCQLRVFARLRASTVAKKSTLRTNPAHKQWPEVRPRHGKLDVV